MGEGRGHSARRIVAMSLAVSGMGMLLALAVAVIPMVQYRSAEARADTEVVGQVTRIGLGKNKDVGVVTWTDEANATHSTRFTFAYPEEWTAGEDFGIRYDRAAPRAQIFPATGFEDYVSSPVDGALLALILALLATGVMAVAWLGRGLLARVAAAASASSWRAIPMSGMSNAVRSSDVVLVPPETPVNFDPLRDDGVSLPDAVRWQRVFWDPALDRISPGELVTARISSGILGRAVLELDDGTRIWPAGRLRRRDYRGFAYMVRPAAFRRPYIELRARAMSGDLEAERRFEEFVRTHFDVPPGHPVDPVDAAFEIVEKPVRLLPRPGYVVPALLGGLFIGWKVGGLPYGPVAGAGAFLALAGFFWGWYGGDPARS